MQGGGDEDEEETMPMIERGDGDEQMREGGGDEDEEEHMREVSEKWREAAPSPLSDTQSCSRATSCTKRLSLELNLA